jgi:hypothetical protein
MIKAVKVLVGTKTVYAVLELFCDPPETFLTVLPHSVHALEAAVTRFREKMNEEKKP